MSRLDRNDTLIDLYGRYLPTPVIDTVRIDDISEDDAEFKELSDIIDASERLKKAQETTYSDSLDSDGVLSPGAFRSRMTKLRFDISVLMNTADGFDAESMGKELFENTTTTGDSDSLYINIIITKNGQGDRLKNNRLELKSVVMPVTDATQEFRDDFAELSTSVWSNTTSTFAQDSYDAAFHIESMITGDDPYIISEPLSNFYNSIRMTTSFDKNNNPILRL